MARIFKNPNLPDYFVEVPGVTAKTDPAQVAPVTEAFEDGKVIVLPDLKFRIDHDFWANLPTDRYPHLKKLTSKPPKEKGLARQIERDLAEAGVPWLLRRRLRGEIRHIHAQVLPIYEALFAGYRFVQPHAVWRLNTIMTENMHVDTYWDPQPNHFARMFINLDNQPRIWHTSWPIKEIYDRYAAKVPDEVKAEADPEKFRAAVSRAAFGGWNKVWWDTEPRHVIFFDPGDVWIVDSRQIAHQIFYGRRALSIDFFVDPASMLHPERQYITMADRLMREAMAAETPPSPPRKRARRAG
ncbi:MAG: Kdo hydroxylase family protein [Caulobacteraceae bacterium]